MNKEDLLKQFRKLPEKHWKVKLFDDLGFKRKQCKNCGKFFWTLIEQQICNDSSCRAYDFIGNPPTKKPLDYFETWKVIEKFFMENGHTSLKRYPAICRWFNLYFTIAGIVDFYRLVDGRLDFELPANPSIVNQICLRFNDVPSVGLNSKSYTCFGMINQQSLYDGKEGYWKDECIELDFKLLTKVFGIKPEEIVFIEDVWIGPSAFGPSLEYHVQGLELGNAVFTQFEGVPGNYREMEKKLIDMGSGWERFCWITQGTPTSYDSTFGPVIEKLKKVCEIEEDKDFFLRYAKLCGRLSVDETQNLKIERQKIANQLEVPIEEVEKKVERLEALYAIADHSRALVFAISDGAIPSNVAGGYNLRVILRRALSFIEKFKWNLKLEDIALWHIDYLKKMFPELVERKEEIANILGVEEKRYKQTRERAKRIVESFEGRKVSEEELIKLYDSEGITPEELGVEVPRNFYAKITEKHMSEKPAEGKITFDVGDLPKTEILCYEPIYEFDANVLKVFDDRFVVLGRSAFFPRSGGQEPDLGFIDNCEVVNVEKSGKFIIHELKECRLREGQAVYCKVDKERKLALTRHHIATHIINAASREVIGPWVWQHSAFKDVDKARLDITHFESLTEEQVEKIEKLANDIIEKDLPIRVEILPRGEAERKYGFKIYQGGAIPEKSLRIVSIGDKDVEACSGTHSLLSSTKEVGYISILRTKRIQDGAVRIEFVAGDVALNDLKEKEKILEEVARRLKVREEEVPKAVEQLFDEWKKKRKELKKRRKWSQKANGKN
ncbi:MAG: alanine--tRNA ligase [Candidatus Aenigmarchaeota archaeon]|nr:alanine--tRNA ligase [Candidatus Aenigmarchaeota archaeon]